MYEPVRRSLITAFLALTPLAATAIPFDRPPPAATPLVPPDLLAELSGWVAQDLGLDAPVAPPAIRSVPKDELPRIASELAGHPVTGRDFVALYLPQTQEIVLSDGWDPASTVDRSVLVHELVHHADVATGFRTECGAERERRAYRAQERWLAPHGETLESAFGLDRFTVLVLTSCGF